MEPRNASLSAAQRNNKLLGLAAFCVVGQLLVAELLDFSFDDYPKLLLLAVNLWMFLAGSLVTSTPSGHFYSTVNVICIASTFVFYVKPMWIIHEGTDSYPALTYPALLFLTAFNALFLGTYVAFKQRLIARRREPSAEEAERSQRTLIAMLWIAWAIGALAFAGNVVAVGGLSNMLLQNTYVERTLANTEASALEQVHDALSAACFLMPVVLYDCYRRLPGRRWMATLLLVVVLASIPGTLLLLASRRYTIALVFAFALILYRDPPRWARASALVAAIASPFLFAYWAALRALPLADIDLEVLLERRDHIVSILFETPELSMFDEYLKVFRDIGDSLPIRWGADYYKMFLVPVPRAVMPDKPLASGTEFLNYYYPNWFDSTGGAVTISTPGELVWNLSYAGIVGAVLYGMLFAYVDERWLRSTDPVRRAIYLLGGFAVAFGFVRGGHHLVLLEFLKLSWPALATAALLAFTARWRLR
jgi:hypothetical protein